MQKLSRTNTHSTDRDKAGRRRRVSHGGTAYLTLRDIIGRTGLSEPTLWRMRNRGDFPQPVRLSPGRVAWRLADIDAWEASRTNHGHAA